jgi:polysaccharide chain length determinant protein (PEP-CTERM system associated)
MEEVSEFNEEQSSERPDIQRYLDVVRRRHIHFLIPLLLGWLVVWGLSWILPPRYQSTTMILVEQPTMPKDYVAPNVSEDIQDRLQSITQQILSRTRLLDIIDKLHLYSDGRNQTTPDEKVELMRKDIDVELVHSEDLKQITGFTIGYSARNPQIAQQVTSELTDLFIDENLKSRQQESEDTTKFIESQLENARATLAEQETKVRQFQGAHEGELPSQEASNLQILSGLQAQLQNEQDTLNTAKQQRVYLQAMIEQYHTLGTTSRTADGTVTGLPAPVTGLQTIDQELDSLKAKMVDLSSRYTDHYPAVDDLKEQIAKTEKMRDEVIAQSKTANDGGKQPDGVAPHVTVDPSQNSIMLQLQGQLQANQAEIANREQAITSLKDKINSYQTRLNNEPASEQQLADLTRGYDQSKANYDDLLKKKNESEMATSMEQMQQGERFSMLDPPNLPQKPDFPNRLKFCGIGLGIGLVLGLVVAGGFEVMDDRLHSEKAIKTMLSTAVLSEIPKLVSLSDKRSSKKRAVLGWAMATLVVTVILVGSALSYLHD